MSMSGIESVRMAAAMTLTAVTLTAVTLTCSPTALLVRLWSAAGPFRAQHFEAARPLHFLTLAAIGRPWWATVTLGQRQLWPTWT